MKITEMSLENRPRERLEHYGAEALSSAELLAIFLKSGTKKENVLEISNRLLSKYGLASLATCSLQELCSEYGIGKAKACQINAMFELQRRVPTSTKEIKQIKTAKDIFTIYTSKMKDLQQEHIIAVYLDAKNKIICDQTISIGILNASLIHPREIFHGAIKHLANSLIVVHNHPSGDPAPSKKDLEITRKLNKVGKLMGIKLLDHIIIAKDGWWSWQESKHNI